LAATSPPQKAQIAMKTLSQSAFARIVSSASAALVAAVAVSTATTAPAAAQSDTMIYSLTGQNQPCTMEQHGPYGGVSWQNTLDLNIDRASSYHGHIVAYHYKTFGGAWTTWYVPGYNDIGTKFYPAGHSLERMWSIFQDHTHEFIICR
jgi:hypothetical protein